MTKLRWWVVGSWLMVTVMADGLAGAVVADPRAEPVPISFELRGTDGELVGENGALRLAPSLGGDPVDLELDAGRATVDLPATSRWTVALQAEGFWSPEGAFEVPGAAVRVPIRVWPTGEIRGRFVFPEEPHDRPDSFEISLESPRAGAKPRAVGGGRFDCAIAADGSWSCELPASELDLVLRVPGFVPIYRWDVEVDVDEVRDLGAMPLAVGGSVAGWVVAPDRRELPDEVVVRLVPHVAAGNESRLSERLGELRRERRVRKDGFFQFAGLSPGSYVLRVEETQGGVAVSEPLEVRTGETLLDAPLVLQAPIDLAVAVTPPLDPEGEPWQISISRASESSGSFDSRPLVHGPLDRAGTYSLPRQPPGTYSLRILDHRDNVYWVDRRRVVETAADGAWRIDVPLIRVEGRVTLGDDPLAGTLWFGGRYGSEHIELIADEDGRFEGFVPRPGTWLIEIDSRTEAVRSSVHAEIGEVESSDGTARVDVQLPDTEIYGQVLEAEDEPAPGAVVDLRTGDVRAETRADDEGQFRVRGLPPGEVRLIAGDARRPQAGSSVVVATLSEDAPTGPIVLEIGGVRRLRGTVTVGGVPVAGALVRALPAEGGGYGDAARTDVEGVFRLSLRESARSLHLVVSPPSHLLTATRAEVGQGDEVFVELSDQGGDLVVLYSEDAELSRVQLTLARDGVPLPVDAVIFWRESLGLPSLTETIGTIEAPRLAPGSYTACYTDLRLDDPEPICDDGTLNPGGRLVLDLRDGPGPAPSP